MKKLKVFHNYFLQIKKYNLARWNCIFVPVCFSLIFISPSIYIQYIQCISPCHCFLFGKTFQITYSKNTGGLKRFFLFSLNIILLPSAYDNGKLGSENFLQFFVLNSVNIVSMDEDSILNQIYEKKICLDFLYDIFYTF